MSKNPSTRASKQPRRLIELIPIVGLPEIREGDDLGRLIFEVARKARISLKDKDICVLAQNIVSKAEGRFASLSSVTPSAKASHRAAKIRKHGPFKVIIL